MTEKIIYEGKYRVQDLGDCKRVTLSKYNQVLKMAEAFNGSFDRKYIDVKVIISDGIPVWKFKLIPI